MKYYTIEMTVIEGEMARLYEMAALIGHEFPKGVSMNEVVIACWQNMLDMNGCSEMVQAIAETIRFRREIFAEGLSDDKKVFPDLPFT